MAGDSADAGNFSGGRDSTGQLRHAGVRRRGSVRAFPEAAGPAGQLGPERQGHTVRRRNDGRQEYGFFQQIHRIETGKRGDFGQRAGKPGTAAEPVCERKET